MGGIFGFELRNACALPHVPSARDGGAVPPHPLLPRSFRSRCTMRALSEPSRNTPVPGIAARAPSIRTPSATRPRVPRCALWSYRARCGDGVRDPRWKAHEQRARGVRHVDDVRTRARLRRRRARGPGTSQPYRRRARTRSSPDQSPEGASPPLLAGKFSLERALSFLPRLQKSSLVPLCERE